jgi:hypothetical protein
MVIILVILFNGILKKKIMKLFTVAQVKKFFSILDRMDRHVSNIWVNPNTKDFLDQNKIYYYCQKEVFVQRTLNKWLKNKYLILYKESEQTELEYKQYISILSVRYFLSYGDNLRIIFFDYSKPTNIWNSLEISHNSALMLEGEWTDDKIHNQLLQFFKLDIPEKEYVFECFDWSKYPKIKKKSQTTDDIYKLIKKEISFKAKTEKEAYKKLKDFQKTSKLIIPPDIKRII